MAGDVWTLAGKTAVVTGATSGVGGVSGNHYSGTEGARLRPEACNDDDALRLWELSAKLTRLAGPQRRRQAEAPGDDARR